MGTDEQDLSVQVARMDERMLSLIKEIQDLKKDQKDHRDETKVLLETLTQKSIQQDSAIDEYRHDRGTIIWIFGILYSGLLAWVEYRART